MFPVEYGDQQKKRGTIPSPDKGDMIETRRSAHQNHPKKKNVSYTYCPDEPVKPISQTVDKNYKFLTETSLANKETKKTNSE